VSRDLDALQVPAQVGGLSFASGLVFDSRNFDPIANVAPIRRGDSGSTNMQHMAVVRDFALPVPPPAVPTTNEPDHTNDTDADAGAGPTDPTTPTNDGDAGTP
jgi:hypothetical protein